jgi:calcium/calmodulin-dependent protein kinase IV
MSRADAREESDIEDPDFHFPVRVHTEVTTGLDYDHEKALCRQLKECTDEELICEIARRRIDIQHRVTLDLVTKYYNFEKLLGRGASGKVFLVQHKASGEYFACKVIKKDGKMNDNQSMSTEIEIMKRVRHQYIITLYELFESSQCMWLIIELANGVGLRGGLADHAHYSEAVAAKYVKQILTAVHYLHSRGVVHRDLKINNILLSNDDPENSIVKIADFGLSALLRPGKDGYSNDSTKRKTFNGLKQQWGTPTHYAPELIACAYGPQADLWSLGCMTFEMMTGYEAFPS